ncbi:porphyrin biosynthetic protein [Stenotrophomonas phage vB_SmaS-DLP_6]|nr:porphyrin biosynthetic protein [Stenotrophomonas phage vB_SmaS-DLP_6]
MTKQKKVYTKADIPEILKELRDLYGVEAAAKPVYDWLCENSIPAGWILTPARRVSRGTYALSDELPVGGARATGPTKARAQRGGVATGLAAMIPQAAPTQSNVVEQSATTERKVVDINSARAARMVLDNLIPEVNSTFVPFGHFKDVVSIIESQIFYPVFITGLSGNGKSEMVEQACARLKRNYIRVNITEETDEDDLIGGNTLIDNNIIFREGPVLTAMRTGSILLLDEVDLNATKILCLQSIMEGKPYFNKKTGEHIHPTAGFNIFATANTKGRGSDSGRFIGTKMMNEAFLERFPITLEQDYPSAAVEKKILLRNFNVLGVNNEDAVKFTENLVRWSEAIRKSFFEGAVDDVISTRRLVAIARAYAIFNDRLKAIKLCLARFDETSKESFTELYTKVDVEVARSTATAAKIDPDDDDISITMT